MVDEAEASKIIFCTYNTLPKKRIYSYSRMGSIVSPNKRLLTFCTGYALYTGRA